MPIYEYECPACGHRFERRQRFDEAPVSSCPACQTGRPRRLLHPVGIIFKGSGFYTTDYRKPESSGEKEKSSGSESTSSARSS
jgi:putative FmdB family regulatory protein